MRHPFTLLLALLLSMSATACLDFGDGFGVASPEAEYRDFAVKSLSFEQIGFDLDFDLGNPNSFPLPVGTLDWNLDLFDQPFSYGKILFEEAPTGAPTHSADGGLLTYLGVQHIPANGEMMLKTPFNVALLDTFEGILRIAQGEDVPFTIGGTLHFESYLGQWDIPFSQSGVWSNGQMVRFLEDAGAGLIEDLVF